MLLEFQTCAIITSYSPRKLCSSFNVSSCGLVINLDGIYHIYNLHVSYLYFFRMFPKRCDLCYSVSFRLAFQVYSAPILQMGTLDTRPEVLKFGGGAQCPCKD